MVGAGKCISKISLFGSFVCDSYAFNQMLAVLLSRISDTGLQNLDLCEMSGGVTCDDVLPKLISSSINSLASLGFAATDWWEIGDSFEQLLVFLGRQTNLTEFAFNSGKLTASQTTKLLQCIA